MNTAVTCLDVRRRLGAEPQSRDADVVEHLNGCTGCAAFARDMLALDGRLERAFRVDVPEGLEARIALDGSLRNRPRRFRPWMAVAASVVMALLLAALAYQHQHLGGAELADAVVKHIENPEEAAALAPDGALIHDASYVQDVMDRSGVRMTGGMDDLTYAHVCLFHGERVAHLVVQGDHGPVTIMLLRHTHVDKTVPVDEDGFHGVIIPAGKGSIAIVTNNATAVQPMERELTSKVEWTL
jgi:Protein of unknown function (DUF3379)